VIVKLSVNWFFPFRIHFKKFSVHHLEKKYEFN
jgi:hypothetical protein